MRINALTKKLVTIIAVLLLVLSFNVSFNASATYIKDTDDGVWFDDFDDDSYVTIDDVTSIDSYDRCFLNATLNSINLSQGANSIPYDSHISKNNVKAWELDRSLITINENDNLDFGSSLLLNPNNVDTQKDSNPFDNSMLNDIGTDDDDYVETKSLYGSFSGRILYPIQYFRFTIDQDPDLVENMEISWNYGAYYDGAHLEKITMFVWTYGDAIPHWESSETITEANMNDGITDLRFTNEVYISDEGAIDFFIIGKPKPKDALHKNSYLRTDYVTISIEVEEGYLPDGHIISEIIEPDTNKFNGWETLFWEGTRPSSKSNITIQILDENKNIISELDNNKEGFTSSPIDLSSLGKSYPKIRVKTLLHSEDLSYTPYLYSWGVMWQTQEGFYDSFSYNFRIDESYGTENDGGNIKISEFYGDWPIFGKNPANTRSYIGLEAKRGSNTTYWHSLANINVGGGSRSPVVSNGRVYVASSDNKIYAFNVTVPNTGEQQAPVNISSNEYVVDSSLAVSGDYLIVATSNTQIGANNKIYALDRNNLSKKMWDDPYPKTDDENICFSSAPTIANGRVFVTSWSGLLWNNPLISQIYAKINSIFGLSLGQNNKLIVLDLASGKQIWDPIELPSASFSTPAVDNGIIFVGCENTEGGSLFAFDENTGDELWNKSIGLIGKSSPVVADTADGKAVFILSREQDLFALKGNDKLFALKAENGEMLWNITISENSTALGNVIKSNKLYEGFQLNNLLATSSPISTVAIQDNTLITMSSQGMVYALDINNKGEEIWSFDASGEGLLKILPSYYSASPVIVNNIVYIAAEQGTLYALDIDSGKIIWDYTVKYPDETYPPKNYVFASPVVSDGLTFISSIEDPIRGDKIGRLFCVGDYKSNTKGKIISTPIHVQKGKWWNEFNAEVESDGKNNTITFSILDENGKEISGFTGLKGNKNSIKGLTSNVIRLCAELTILNTTHPTLHSPILKSWEISWVDEAGIPEFIYDSFNSGGGKEGWINEDLPVCSIDAKDEGSGLDLSTAKFKIRYIATAGSDPITSSWYAATSEDSSGEKQVTITADISSLDLDIFELKNITFSIKDLAGKPAKESKHPFQMDTKEPASSITNDFKAEYNFDDQGIDVTANAIDEANEEEKASGIEFVTLKYRNSAESNDLDDIEWKEYDTTLSPYSWTFIIKTDMGMVSSYYQLVTVAKDLAGNEEKIVSSKISDTFLFDINKPEMMKSLPSKLNSMTAPFVELSLSDDFELESVSYRPDSETSWTVIDSNIDDTTYESTWTVPQDYWDTIEPGEGQGHYIFFRVKDLAGNELNTTEKNTPYIVKNESITDFYVDLSDFAEMQWDDKFTITATAPDDIDVESIKLYYRFSAESDDLDDIEWKKYGSNKTSAPYEWEFVASDGNGYYEFRTITTDTSGNLYQSEPESVKVSLLPTSSATIMILLTILLVAITIFVLRKMKKKEE